jgi:hypothetical protein
MKHRGAESDLRNLPLVLKMDSLINPVTKSDSISPLNFPANPVPEIWMIENYIKATETKK